MASSKSKDEVVSEFRIQSIQEAAMRVIARKGMSAATMADIASEAGIAKGTSTSAIATSWSRRHSRPPSASCTNGSTPLSPSTRRSIRNCAP